MSEAMWSEGVRELDLELRGQGRPVGPRTQEHISPYLPTSPPI